MTLATERVVQVGGGCGEARVDRYPSKSDEEVAQLVKSLRCSDLDHGLVCTAGSNRILVLANERDRLRKLITAAEHLIRRVTGDGAPRSWNLQWNDDRDVWLGKLKEEGIDLGSAWARGLEADSNQDT